MTHNKLFFWLAFCLFTFAMAIAYGEPAGRSQIEGQAQQSVMGTIDKITEDTISVKTDEGKTHKFSINRDEKEGIKSKGLMQGDRIVLTVDQKNQVVEVNKLDQGESGMRREPNINLLNPDQANPNSNPSSSPDPLRR